MTQNTKIPFVDLVTPHRELRDELVHSFQAVLDTAAFVGGSAVEGFEREFAAFCDTAHCVGVGSGTEALRLALAAAGVGEGDIVLTVPHTFIATAEAISQVGARPDFVDIDPRTYTMDPEMLRRYLETECVLDRHTNGYLHRRLGAPVKAVIPVHLYGQTADMDPILELAERFKLIVVEDACQAHGALYFSRKENRWRKAGSMGRAAAFSFYPGKNLGACGEAGAVTTNDAGLARTVSMLRDHGQSRKYYHDLEGTNGRLDAVQAAILRVKLRHLSRWNEERRECAQRYRELLASQDTAILAQAEAPYSQSVYHLYVIRTSCREELRKHLADAQIETGIHYPIPLHLQRAYASHGWRRGDFPAAEEAADQILSLPMYPGLKADQQIRIVEAIAEFAHMRSVT